MFTCLEICVDISLYVYLLRDMWIYLYMLTCLEICVDISLYVDLFRDMCGYILI